MFLKCLLINSCCFPVTVYVVRLQKQSGKISQGSWKVLEFMVSNIVGTLWWVTETNTDIWHSDACVVCEGQRRDREVEETSR